VKKVPDAPLGVRWYVVAHFFWPLNLKLHRSEGSFGEEGLFLFRGYVHSVVMLMFRGGGSGRISACGGSSKCP
jgi:hypothetical protein